MTKGAERLCSAEFREKSVLPLRGQDTEAVTLEACLYFMEGHFKREVEDLSQCAWKAHTVYVYDKETLLHIRSFVTPDPEFNFGAEFNHLPRPLVFPGLPANWEFSYGEGIAGCRRRRRRKRGRRAGALVQLKRLLGDPTTPAGVRISAEAEGLQRYHIAPRSWDNRYVWLRVVDLAGGAPGCWAGSYGCTQSKDFKPVELAVKRRGVNPANLRLIPRSQKKEDRLCKLALLNIRSLSNKTFLINDFISSQELDFLFLTETWLKAGENHQLVELCPENYQYLNSPRTCGRGGGVAAVYRNSIKCSWTVFEF
ncbi:hypothetical protein MHYP_G00298800 [Metynnis hypsauchen]